METIYTILSSPYTYGFLLLLTVIGWFLFAQGCKAHFIMLDMKVFDLEQDNAYYKGQFDRALTQISKLKETDTYYKEKYEESLKSISLRDDLIRDAKRDAKHYHKKYCDLISAKDQRN